MIRFRLVLASSSLLLLELSDDECRLFLRTMFEALAGLRLLLVSLLLLLSRFLLICLFEELLSELLALELSELESSEDEESVSESDFVIGAGRLRLFAAEL